MTVPDWAFGTLVASSISVIGAVVWLVTKITRLETLVGSLQTIIDKDLQKMETRLQALELGWSSLGREVAVAAARQETGQILTGAVPRVIRDRGSVASRTRKQTRNIRVPDNEDDE